MPRNTKQSIRLILSMKGNKVYLRVNAFQGNVVSRSLQRFVFRSQLLHFFRS